MSPTVLYHPAKQTGDEESVEKVVTLVDGCPAESLKAGAGAGAYKKDDCNDRRLPRSRCRICMTPSFVDDSDAAMQRCT